MLHGPNPSACRTELPAGSEDLNRARLAACSGLCRDVGYTPPRRVHQRTVSWTRRHDPLRYYPEFPYWGNADASSRSAGPRRPLEVCDGTP